MIPANILDCGTASGYSVTVQRRDSAPQDGFHGPTSLAVILAKPGTAPIEAVVLDDNGADAPRYARFAGLAVVNALRAVNGK